nr:ATP synthase subunit 8 [Ancistrocerus claripennis]
MPHLSPLKWFFIYICMMIWTLIMFIKMNYIYYFYPKKIKFNSMKFYLKWKI